LELAIDRLEKHFGANFPAHAITSDQIETYREARRADKSKPSEPTIARELRRSRQRFAWATRMTASRRFLISKCPTNGTALKKASFRRRK
jgi:hypothetical protein